MKREGKEEKVWWDWNKNFKLKTVCKQIEVYLLQVFTWRVRKVQKERMRIVRSLRYGKYEYPEKEVEVNDKSRH